MIFARLARIPGIKAACAASLAIFMLGSGAVAANAYWSAAATASTTASAATFSMTAGNFSTLNTTYMFTTAQSSPIVIKPITVSNTGSAPMTFSIGVTNTNATLAANLTLWLWTTGSSNCGTTPLNIPGTVASPPAMPSGAANPSPNSAVTLCAATQLVGPMSAMQGQSVVATFTITGRVGASSWVTSAATSTTQSVYSVPAPTPTCVTTDQKGQKEGFSTLTWPAVVGATGYQVFVDTVGAPAATTPSLTRTLTDPRSVVVGVIGGDVNISADSNVRIVYTGNPYGTSQASTTPIYYQGPFWHGNERPESTSCTP